MSDLVGKVVGISWQDIWWSMDERAIDTPFEDEQFVHFTYGLVLRETDDFISIAHEWRPQRQLHAGTTSIPKQVIRSLKVYGDGSIETPSKERKRAKRAAAGSRKAAKRAARPANPS